MNEKIPIIIPAAGFAQRHPGKLLTDVRGRPALARTVEIVLEAGHRPMVVLGHHADQLQLMLEEQFHGAIPTLLNSRYPEGMAFSIRTGLQALGDVPCFAVHLGDKPFVESETVRVLAAEFLERRPRILLPLHEGRVGHPVFFEGALKGELMHTEGDFGGRELLERYAGDVEQVEVEDEGTVLDLDRYLETGGG